MYSCEDFVKKFQQYYTGSIHRQIWIYLRKKKDIFINDQQKPTIRVSFKNVSNSKYLQKYCLWKISTPKLLNCNIIINQKVLLMQNY